MKWHYLAGAVVGSFGFVTLASAEGSLGSSPEKRFTQEQLDQAAKAEHLSRLREWANGLGIELRGAEAVVAAKDPRLLATSLGMRYRIKAADSHDYNGTHNAATLHDN